MGVIRLIGVKMKKSNIICILLAALGLGYGLGMSIGNLVLRDDLARAAAYIEVLESHFSEMELEMIRWEKW